MEYEFGKGIYGYEVGGGSESNVGAARRVMNFVSIAPVVTQRVRGQNYLAWSNIFRSRSSSSSDAPLASYCPPHFLVCAIPST